MVFRIDEKEKRNPKTDIVIHSWPWSGQQKPLVKIQSAQVVNIRSAATIVRPVGVLTLAAMDVRKRCADLPETKICTCIRHTFEPGKRHPFGHLLTAQAPEELVRVGEPEGKAEAEVETALGTPLEFFESSSTSAPDKPFNFCATANTRSSAAPARPFRRPPRA